VAVDRVRAATPVVPAGVDPIEEPISPNP
jgi:hypothetical protein